MAEKHIIPAVDSNSGNYNVNTSKDITCGYHNLSPLRTGMQEFVLTVRPNLGAVVTTMSVDDNSIGRGIADFQGYDLMMVNDDTMYYSGGSTEIFSTQGFSKSMLGKYTIYNQSGSQVLVLVNAGDASIAGTNDGSIWYHTDKDAVPTQVTDGDAIGNNGQSLVRGGVSLDGFFFVADIDGKIMNCVLDDITDWNSLGFLTAERRADVGVYLGEHHDHVVMISTRSIEMFYNANVASPASPLLPRKDIFFNTGCYHPNTVVELGDVIYFVGKDSSGDAGIFALKDFKVTKMPVSPVLDSVIKSLEYAAPDISAATNFQLDVWMAAFNSADKGQFLVLTTATEGTYAIHLDTGLVAKWYLGETPANNGLITDWTTPKILPIVASLNRTGADVTEPNRFVLLNGLVTSEVPLPIEFSTFTTASKTYEPNGLEPIYGIELGDNNTKLYTLLQATDKYIEQANLSTAGDISTATYLQRFTLAVDTRDFAIRDNGIDVFMCNITADTITHWQMSTAWDITTLVDTGNSFSINSEDSGPRSLAVSPDGTTVLVLGATNKNIYSYTLSTGWLPSSASYSGKSFDPAEEDNPFRIEDGFGGTKLYILDGTDQSDTHEYAMTTPWDLDTIKFVASTTGMQDALANNAMTMHVSDEGICYAPDDISGGATDTIFQFTMATIVTELSGAGAAGVSLALPDYIAYFPPWDMSTQQRKRVNNIRALHYADGRAGKSPSNITIDWLDLDRTSELGVVPTSFTGTRTVDLSSQNTALYRCGVTRQRIHKVIFNGDTSQMLKGLELEFDLLRG